MWMVGRVLCRSGEPQEEFERASTRHCHSQKNMSSSGQYPRPAKHVNVILKRSSAWSRELQVGSNLSETRELDINVAGTKHLKQCRYTTELCLESNSMSPEHKTLHVAIEHPIPTWFDAIAFHLHWRVSGPTFSKTGRKIYQAISGSTMNLKVQSITRTPRETCPRDLSSVSKIARRKPKQMISHFPTHIAQPLQWSSKKLPCGCQLWVNWETLEVLTTSHEHALHKLWVHHIFPTVPWMSGQQRKVDKDLARENNIMRIN